MATYNQTFTRYAPFEADLFGEANALALPWIGMPHNYDLVLAGYPMEPATAAYGVRTPVVTSSYDDVMVVPKDTAATQRGLWSFAEPFHWTLWVAVIFSMATTGVLFVAFEYGTADEFSPPHSRCAWVVEVIRVVKIATYCGLHWIDPQREHWSSDQIIISYAEF